MKLHESLYFEWFSSEIWEFFKNPLVANITLYIMVMFFSHMLETCKKKRIIFIILFQNFSLALHL